MKITKIGEYINTHGERFFYWEIQKGEERRFYSLLKEKEFPDKKTSGYFLKDYLIDVKKTIKLYN